MTLFTEELHYSPFQPSAESELSGNPRVWRTRVLAVGGRPQKAASVLSAVSAPLDTGAQVL